MYQRRLKLYYKSRATLGVSVKNRNDYADYDYLHKLDEKTLFWLKGFHREFVNSDFQHKYKKIYRGIKKKRQIYNLNNQRNRCLYNKTKWSNKLVMCWNICLETNHFEYQQYKSINTQENYLIKMIDLKKANLLSE